MTGRFDPDATQGCFAARAAIGATEVELLSEIASELRERNGKGKAGIEIRFLQEFKLNSCP